MMEFLTESAKSNTTNQRLDDQVRLILQENWLSDLEIKEICRQVNCEQHYIRKLRKGTETHDIDNAILTEPRNT